MAFGFGFNKQKVLSAAEKFVQQGKLQNAIAEYEKVLKADPKDLTVANTVGDLYSRLGNIDKAVESFKSVGDAYAAQGFTVKAIAMYKKLSKIRHSFEGVLRLAELYTQQGLFNDARAQYLQVAEEFLRSGELEQAVRIFQKILEMDPDNVIMRTKLAEVYVRLGKKAEAWQIFAAAVETLRTRGQLEGAETILQRMLTLDPGNSYALLLRGRTAVDSGDISGAIESLEKVADLDNHPEGLTALFNAYLQSGRLPEARVLAGKLLTVHNDAGAVNVYAQALMTSGDFEGSLQVYGEYSDSLLASDPTKVLDSLHSIISHVRDNPASLEIILALFTRAGENSHTTEVYELLAHAYVQSGNPEKARDYYQKLTQLEPQNQLHARNYQQLVEKLGGSVPRLISVEEGSILIEELEATAPFVDQRYDDDVALAVRAALTDAELFISYNMPEKAIAPLLSVLPKAPQDLRLNQRLAALHNRAERFSDAAICCRTLESIYHDAGFPEEATRYGGLAARYEERAASAASAAARNQGSDLAANPPETTAAAVHFAPPINSDDDATIAPVATASQEAAPSGLFFHTAPASAAPADRTQEFEVGPAEPASSEIDLSGEWDGTAPDEIPSISGHAELPATAVPSSSVSQHAATGEQPLTESRSEAPAVDPELITATTEEVRFYLANSMIDLANAALANLEQLKPDPAVVLVLREEIAEATAKLAATHDETAAEISVVETDSYSTPEPVPTSAAQEPEIAVNAPAANGALDNLVSDLESSLITESRTTPPATEVAPEPIFEKIPAARAELVEAASESKTEIPQVALHTEAKSEDLKYAEVNLAPAASDALTSIVSDLEASLGDDFIPKIAAPTSAHSELQAHAAGMTPPLQTDLPSPPAAMAAAASGSSSAFRPRSPSFTTFTKPPVANQPPVMEEAPPVTAKDEASAGIDLAGMFGELKQELEADAAANMDEDPETHYNLGVAFREMGLLDEAIGELQKVCQTVEHGHPFSQILQTYTWLAQCFLDKGIPEAALRWYERALTLPTLDGETRMALHYELACACESSGDKPSALHHFMEVYGSNIDYRDVSERIKALRS